jgi:hypothetical protein
MQFAKMFDLTEITKEAVHVLCVVHVGRLWYLFCIFFYKFTNMKKIIFSLLFIGATSVMASAQNSNQQKKTTVNANVGGNEVNASKTKETTQSNGQSSTQTNQTNQTSTSKRTTATTNKSGVHMNAGKHKGTAKRSSGTTGKRTGQVKRTTKTTTSTSTSSTSQQ